MPSAQHLHLVSKRVPRNHVLATALIIATAAIDSVTVGYDGSLMGSLNVMETYTNYFNLTTATLGLNTSIIFVGAALSALVAAKLINWRGRWEIMVYASVLLIIGAVIQAAAQGVAMFIVGRLILGLGTGLSNVAAPTYVAETAPPKWRAFALGLYYTLWSVGTLVAAGVCYGTENMDTTWAWRLPSLLQIIAPVIALIILCFLPESPRWLVYQDRVDEGLQVITIMSGCSSIDHDIVQVQYREIVDTINFEKREGASLGFRETVKTRVNRRRVMLAASVAPIAMLTGSNLITYYFGTMLSQAGITSAHTQLEINIILSAWQLVIAVCGSLSAERIGRKRLAIGSLSLCTIFFFMVGGLTAKYGNSTSTSGIYGTVATIFLFLGAYSFGITPLTVMYPPEVLSYSIRGSGMSVYTISTKLCGLFVTWVFPYSFAAIGWKTYIINASFDILCVAWIWWQWVETSGLTLEEVDEKFDGKHSEVPDLNLVIKGKIDLGETGLEEIHLDTK